MDLKPNAGPIVGDTVEHIKDIKKIDNINVVIIIDGNLYAYNLKKLLDLYRS